MATNEEKAPAKKAAAVKKTVEPKNVVETKKESGEKKDFAQTIIQMQNQKEEKVVCDVCGYANPEFTAICKQCSNYLK